MRHYNAAHSLFSAQLTPDRAAQSFPGAGPYDSGSAAGLADCRPTRSALAPGAAAGKQPRGAAV
jgi:hypothetical protein